MNFASRQNEHGTRVEWINAKNTTATRISCSTLEVVVVFESSTLFRHIAFYKWQQKISTESKD